MAEPAREGARPGVALGGFMGVGKSTVGRVLSERLGLPFVDTDAVLTTRHGPIDRQIAVDEPGFRVRERALVAELCDGVARVVATGGGVFAHAPSRARLGRHHHLVVLRARLDTLRSRVGEGTGRPLWGQGVEALLRAREPAYAQAELQVDTDGLSVQQVVEEVLWALSAAR